MARRIAACALGCLLLAHPGRCASSAAPVVATVTAPRLQEPTPAPMPSPAVPTVLRPLAPYLSTFAAQARATGVPASLLEAVTLVESGGHPWAVSDRGAVGIMQVMPSTGHAMGVWGLRSPVASIVAGARYLHWLAAQVGASDACLASGPGGAAGCAWRTDLVLSSYDAGLRGRYQPGYVADVRRQWVETAREEAAA